MTNYSVLDYTGAPGTVASDNSDYTFGMEFSVNTAGCTLAGVRFNSATGAANLPGTIALFSIPGTSLVHSESASWSGAAGSGLITASFASPPALTSGTHYKVATLRGNGGIGNWYSSTSNFWSSGAGSGGLSSGPVTAPSNAGSTGGGQDTFNAGSALTYPASVFNATNYWVDVIVNAGTDFDGPSSLALAPMGLAGQGAAGIVAQAGTSLALAPMALAVGALVGGNVTATGSLALAPMALAAQQARGGTPGADRHHHRAGGHGR